MREATYSAMLEGVGISGKHAFMIQVCLASEL